jgi:phenylpropionate dioxygenase-like ring-hydroxylating dioxygenase large terminal subunit
MNELADLAAPPADHDAQSNARAARSNQDGMAGPDTALIGNCWYVAAWGSEVTRTLSSKRLLGRQILLYRRQDGTPVALHDRCPHRSLPLSKGRLEGDQVRCGYHGLVFDSGGRCTEAPPVGTAPRSMTVPAYSLVEQGPLLWIWLGDRQPDPESIPNVDWLGDPYWTYGHGAMTIQSNYVSLHENLLDLTHFTFLHPGNIGTPEYASAPYQVTTQGDRVTVERFVAECSLPGIYTSTGLDDRRISRRTISEFVSPALHAASVDLTDLSPRAGSRSVFTVRVTHFVTPCDRDSTHYFFAIARNFALNDSSATATMRQAALQAFQEDADALEAITANQRLDPHFIEKSMKSDLAGVTMRRIVKRLSDVEMRIV